MDETTVKTLLRPLFASFPTSDGDTHGKLSGYLIALERVTPGALRAAVRAYLSGEVAGHDRRFLPTCAELAERCRYEQRFLDLPRRPTMIVDNTTLQSKRMTPAERRAKIDALDDGPLKTSLLEMAQVIEARR